MKSVYPLFTLILFLWACNGSQEMATSESTLSYDNSPFQKDTVYTNYIDSLTFAVNKNMFHQPKHQYFDTTIVDKPNLEIGYYVDPSNDIVRILISENEHRLMNIRYFFVKNGIPLLMHYRYWDKNPTPQVTEEMYVYFDENGKMVYAGERGTQLYEGEIPAKLKGIDLAVPQKSKKELMGEVLEYWNIVKPIMENK